MATSVLSTGTDQGRVPTSWLLCKGLRDERVDVLVHDQTRVRPLPNEVPRALHSPSSPRDRFGMGTSPFAVP